MFLVLWKGNPVTVISLAQTYPVVSVETNEEKVLVVGGKNERNILGEKPALVDKYCVFLCMKAFLCAEAGVKCACLFL